MSEPRYTPTPGGMYPGRKAKKKSGNRKAGELHERGEAKTTAKRSTSARIFSIVWKSVLAGIIYFVSVVFFGGLVLGIGANLPDVRSELEIYLFELFISGAAISALLGPLHAGLNLSMNKRFLSISLIVFLTSTALLLEETFFRSGSNSHDMLPGLIIQHFLVSVMIGYTVASLFRSEEIRREKNDEVNRTAVGWIWRVGASIAAFCVIYYGVGFLHEAVALRPSFQSAIGTTVIPDLPDISLLTPLHGSLMIAAILPLVILTQTTALKKATIGGTVLFVVGGILPVLTKLAVFPLPLLTLTLAEIFLQYFLSGAFAGFLIGKKEALHAAETTAE